jgi:hypothetical protein
VLKLDRLAKETELKLADVIAAATEAELALATLAEEMEARIEEGGLV